MKNCKTRWVTKLLLLITTMLIVMPAYALRCGNDIVQIGDSQARVFKVCGKPAFKADTEKKVKLNTSGATIRTISQWTYNFGANDFLYILTFSGGKLVAIDTDGYGY